MGIELACRGCRRPAAALADKSRARRRHAAAGKTDAFSSIPASLGEVVERARDAGWERRFDQQDFLLGIAMNKRQPKLKAWIDGWVATNERNGSLDDIFRKYHGHDLPAAVRP